MHMYEIYMHKHQKATYSDTKTKNIAQQENNTAT